MLAVADGMFVPDTSLYTPTIINGVIDPLVAGRDYKIILGEQTNTKIKFKQGSDHVTISASAEWLTISSNIQLSASWGGVSKIESFIIRVASDSIQLLKVNGDIVNVRAYQLTDDFDEVGLEASNLPVDVSNVFIQLGWATKLTDAPFMSAYFQAKIGKFSLANSNAGGNGVVITGVDIEPTKKITASDLGGGFVIYILFIGGNLNVALGDYSGMGNMAYVTKENPSPNSVVTFEVTGTKSMNVYIDNEFVGSWTSNSTLALPEYYQIVSLDGLTNLDFDLSEAYETLEYNNPTDVDDCVYYHLTSSGELFGKPVKEGDFVQFYNNHSGIIHHPQ